MLFPIFVVCVVVPCTCVIANPNMIVEWVGVWVLARRFWTLPVGLPYVGSMVADRAVQVILNIKVDVPDTRADDGPGRISAAE